MVRRPGKSLLTWLLAVMIGGLSVLGEELHELLGLHHRPVVSVCGSDVSGFSYGIFCLKMGISVSLRQPTIVKAATTAPHARSVSIWPKGEWSASELWSFRLR